MNYQLKLAKTKGMTNSKNHAFLMCPTTAALPLGGTPQANCLAGGHIKKAPQHGAAGQGRIAATGGNWISAFDAALIGLAGHLSARNVRIDAGVGDSLERGDRLCVVSEAGATDHRLLVEGAEHPASGQHRAEQAAEVALVESGWKIGHGSDGLQVVRATGVALGNPGDAFGREPALREGVSARLPGLDDEATGVLVLGVGHPVPPVLEDHLALGQVSDELGLFDAENLGDVAEAERVASLDVLVHEIYGGLGLFQRQLGRGLSLHRIGPGAGGSDGICEVGKRWPLPVFQLTPTSDDFAAKWDAVAGKQDVGEFAVKPEFSLFAVLAVQIDVLKSQHIFFGLRQHLPDVDGDVAVFLAGEFRDFAAAHRGWHGDRQHLNRRLEFVHAQDAVEAPWLGAQHTAGQLLDLQLPAVRRELLPFRDRGLGASQCLGCFLLGLKMLDDRLGSHAADFIGKPILCTTGKYPRADLISLSHRQNPTMESIGSRVRALRKSKRWTQVQLAQKLQISQGSLSDIETGATIDVAGTTLDALCRELDTSPSFIINGVEDGESHEMAMRESELVSIFRKLPTRAQEALLHSARTVQQAIHEDAPAEMGTHTDALLRRQRTKKIDTPHSRAKRDQDKGKDSDEV